MGAKASTLGPSTVLGPHAANMTDLRRPLEAAFPNAVRQRTRDRSDDPAQLVGSCKTMESGEFLYRLRDTKDGYQLVSNSNPRDYRDDLVPSIEKNHRRDVLESCSEYVAVVRPDVGRFVLFTVASGTKTEYYVVNEYFVPDIEEAAEIKFTLTPLTFKSRLDAPCASCSPA